MRTKRLTCFFLFILLIIFQNCSKKIDPCDVVGVNAQGYLYIKGHCEDGSLLISGAQYTTLGDILSYSFTVTCENGKRIYTGNVTNTWSGTTKTGTTLIVNGKRCQ